MELLNEKSEKLATRRTYKLLKAGLFHLLMEMPFEKISLTEICTRSLVPRSTFYRYFEDKHDLLCYCFQTFFDEANLEEDVLYLRNVDSMKEFLWKILRIMEQNRAAIYKIYETNKDALLYLYRRIPAGQPAGSRSRRVCKERYCFCNMELHYHAV